MIKTLSYLPLSEPVAQLVEQLPFKPWVEGSSPSRFTFNSLQL